MEIQEESPSYSLSRALLIYGDPDRECIVTSHKVKGGVIQPGDPVDLESSLRGLRSKGNDQDELSWIFPRTIAEHPAYRVWWSPAKVRPVFIDGKPRKAWTPPLIWCGHRAKQTCYLFAYEGGDPSPKTIVYHPAFGPTGGFNHVHHDCMICVGTSNPGNFTPPEWEASFWDSNFKTDGNLTTIKPYAIAKAFKKIGTLETALRPRLQAHGASAD